MPKDASLNIQPHSSGSSATIESLLVELYDSHRLYDLAPEKKPETRAELTRIVAGLMSAEFKLSEREQIADILISLMRQAEADLRAAIAERLSTHENVPLRLVLFLANDDISVAETVLRQSPVLNDLDLLYIIQSRTASYWKAIAGRTQLQEPVIDALADTKDLPTACTLAKNTHVKLTDYAFKTLGEMAQNAVELAKPLLQRHEIPETIARRIYEAVGNEIQSNLNALNNLTTDNVLRSVRDVIEEFAPKAENTSLFVPSTAMIKAAEVFYNRGDLTIDLMLKTLKRGQFQSFVAQFSTFTRTTPNFTVQFLQQDDGHVLAMASRAHNLTRDQFIGIYLLSQRMRTTDGLINHRAFNAAVAYFDRISTQLATKIFSKHQI